jgi:hypothetical protein
VKRFAAFFLLLLIFVVLTFPQERLLSHYLKTPLSQVGIRLDVGSAGFAAPAHYQLDNLRLQRGPLDLRIDSASINLFRNLEATLCGGELTGDIDGVADVNLSFHDLDPGRCARYGDLKLDTSLDGTIQINGLGLGGVLGLGNEGAISIESPGGSVAGTFPGSGGASGVELGDWDFGPVSLQATIEDGSVKITHGAGEISGVRFEVRKGKLWESTAGQPQIDIYLRARPSEPGARAKAVIGLMPRAEADADGWRIYRVTGDLDAPEFIGLR